MTYQQQQQPSWAPQWSPPQPPADAEQPTTPPASAVPPTILPGRPVEVPPWPVPAWQAPVARRPGTVPSVIAAAGFLAVVAGAFMPWASVFLLALIGINTEAGVLSMGFGLLGLLLVGLAQLRPPVFGVLGVLTAGVVVVMSAYYVVAVAAFGEESELFGASVAVAPVVGSGLWVTLIGALVAGGGSAACALKGS